jgi:hypothetical protein
VLPPDLPASLVSLVEIVLMLTGLLLIASGALIFYVGMFRMKK